MDVGFTITQKQRLVELNGNPEAVQRQFSSAEERNWAFKESERELIKEQKRKLRKLLEEEHQGLSLKIESQLREWLKNEEGFTQVATPAIISSKKLENMGIHGEHPLRRQVFWLDEKNCLRPMLAPNLYEVMRDLRRITGQPVRIFEIGSCFRKESQGAQHMNEFTMLNLVELAGVEEGDQMERLKELAKGAMKAVGVQDYELRAESSEVYGETLDIEINGTEVASGAYGPHFLDSKWGIFDTWVGIGFGIERITMVSGNYQTIKHGGKSISYIDGVPLNL